MKEPTIELKNIKRHAGLSQETHAYTATVYVDGKKWGSVENSGHGGPDLFNPDKGGYEAERELNDRVKATFDRYPPSEHFPEGMERTLETVCGDLVDEWLFAKEWKSRLRRNLVAIKDNEIYTWPAKHKPGKEMNASFRKKFPDYTLLNDLEVGDALTLIREVEDAAAAAEAAG